MKVRNQSERPIKIGRGIIEPGQVGTVDDVWCYTPRAQTLCAAGDIAYLFDKGDAAVEETAAEPEVEAPANDAPVEEPPATDTEEPDVPADSGDSGDSWH